MMLRSLTSTVFGYFRPPAGLQVCTGQGCVVCLYGYGEDTCSALRIRLVFSQSNFPVPYRKSTE